MAFELIRDMIRFDQVVGEGQSQTLVDRDIIVPDIKPDIATILSVEGKVNITSKDVEQNRVALEGTVSFQILYSASGEPQPIYSMSQSANFSHFINIPGAMPKMEPNVSCDIEHIDFNKLNGRKLNVQCVLDLKGKVVDRIPVDIIKEVTGASNIQLMRDAVVTDEIVGDNSSQTIIKETLRIPETGPAADEVLKYGALIHNKDIRVEDDRVVVSGSIYVPILYSSKGDEKDVYRVDEDMVFSHTIEVPGAAPGMECSVEYNVEDVYAELRENEDGEARDIDVEVVAVFKAKVVRRNEFPVIVDVYSTTSRIDSEMKNIDMDLYFGRDMSQAVIKESLALPQGMPEIAKIYDMICKPTITDYKVSDDKVVVEGVVGCSVIYLARGEERVVSSFSDEVPFRSSITIPGCKAHMKPEVGIDIESMGFTMLTKDEVEVKVVLNSSAIVYDKVSKSFIIKMDEADGEVCPHKASITIYMVQPMDTLWKIAKRYFTTVDNIIRVNELTGLESIEPGMKLLIPKKM